MTHAFLIVSFFVLSWKWYLFGACMWGFYFWQRRKQQVLRGAHRVDVRRTGRAACQLGLILGAFAFIVSAPVQWTYVATGFAVGAVLGWTVAYCLTKRLNAQGSPEQTSGRLDDLSWIVLAVGSTVAIAAIVSKLCASVLVTLLLLWAASAGWLAAGGLYVSLRTAQPPAW